MIREDISKLIAQIRGDLTAIELAETLGEIELDAIAKDLDDARVKTLFASLIIDE